MNPLYTLVLVNFGHEFPHANYSTVLMQVQLKCFKFNTHDNGHTMRTIAFIVQHVLSGLPEFGLLSIIWITCYQFEYGGG